MDLVERYIAAIKFWLPSAGKDDIAAELAEDIRCEIEEAERQKGRKLSEDEVAELLKARGAPVVVASRYMPQRHLIGPELFPVYIFVLKIVAAICLLPLLFAGIAALFASPDTVLTHLPTATVPSLLTAFAVVTIIFAIIEYKGIIPAKSRSWNPKALPSVSPKGRIKRADSIGGIIACLVYLWLFLAGYLSHAEYSAPNFHLVLTPVWVPYCQVFLLLALAEITLCAVNLFHPLWTALKILIRVLIDLSKAAAFYWLLQSNLLRTIAFTDRADVDSAQFLLLSGQLASYAGVIAGTMAALTLVVALWRFSRVNRQHRFVMSAG